MNGHEESAETYPFDESALAFLQQFVEFPAAHPMQPVTYRSEQRPESSSTLPTAADVHRAAPTGLTLLLVFFRLPVPTARLVDDKEHGSAQSSVGQLPILDTVSIKN